MKTHCWLSQDVISSQKILKYIVQCFSSDFYPESFPIKADRLQLKKKRTSKKWHIIIYTYSLLIYFNMWYKIKLKYKKQNNSGLFWNKIRTVSSALVFCDTGIACARFVHQTFCPSSNVNQSSTYTQNYRYH